MNKEVDPMCNERDNMAEIDGEVLDLTPEPEEQIRQLKEENRRLRKQIRQLSFQNSFLWA